MENQIDADFIKELPSVRSQHNRDNSQVFTIGVFWNQYWKKYFFR